MNDHLEDGFVDWLRKMPPEIWSLSVSLEFLDFWRNQYLDAKKNNLEVSFLPPGVDLPVADMECDCELCIPKKVTPISDKEVEEFQGFLDEFKGGFSTKKPPRKKGFLDYE